MARYKQAKCFKLVVIHNSDQLIYYLEMVFGFLPEYMPMLEYGRSNAPLGYLGLFMVIYGCGSYLVSGEVVRPFGSMILREAIHRG